MYSHLLYRASVDTFATSAFHAKCDNVAGTLTIVKTTDGKIIGGFTNQTWNHTGGRKHDASAWLFNIEADNIFKIKQASEGHAIRAK